MALQSPRSAPPRESHHDVSVSRRRRSVLSVAAGVLVLGLLGPAFAAQSADAATTSVSQAEPVYGAAFVGQQPTLPATVTVNSSSGSQQDIPVSWDFTGYTFAQAYRTLTVYGTTSDGLVVSAQVEVVPNSTEYFIDSGEHGSTPPYDSVKALVGSALQNGSADQQSSPGSWGYVNDGNAYVGQVNGTLSDMYDTGLYAYGSGSSSQPIIYNVPLKAGTHTLTAGFKEWWNGREMKVSVVAPSGATTVIAADVKISANGQNGPQTTLVSNQFTTDMDGVAQVRMDVVPGTYGAPVISWLGVASGNVSVDTTATTVAPPTASVAAGIYKTSQQVSLTNTTAGASIYYTTDGSTASRANGTKYTGPIPVSQSETISAISFLSGTSSSQAQFAYDIEPVPSSYTAPPIGKLWYDTSGTAIQGHGGNILKHGAWYYWVGENKTDNSTKFSGISLYKSKDLTNWNYVRDILTSSSAHDLANANVERPKLLFNAKTNTFVLWAHWETANSYSASHLLVATSKDVTAKFTFLRDFRPGVGQVTTPDADPTYTGTDQKWGYGSRDFTVFQDPATGDAYLVSTQDSNSMRVYKLTDDYTEVDWQASYPLFVNDRREAPALVKVGQYYVLFTSSQSGWYPNQAMYSYTKNIADPTGWSALQPVGNNTTFYSQPTNILPLTAKDGSTQYIYMGDRWNPSVLGASTYLWLPLQFSSTNGSSPSAAMKYTPGWSVDANAGTITVPTDTLVSQGKPVTGTQAAGGSNPLSAANDGNYFNLNTSGDDTNFYQPTGVPYTWQVDLQQQYSLSRADLSFRSYNGSETYSGYTIDGSNNGTTWTRLASELANKQVGFKSDALSGSYRYVRVSVTNVVNDHNGNEADWAAGLVEVQVYAK